MVYGNFILLCSTLVASIEHVFYFHFWENQINAVLCLPKESQAQHKVLWYRYKYLDKYKLFVVIVCCYCYLIHGKLVNQIEFGSVGCHLFSLLIFQAFLFRFVHIKNKLCDSCLVYDILVIRTDTTVCVSNNKSEVGYGINAIERNFTNIRWAVR